jgi:phenylacetic acid degradation operon negative regulatory protein
MRPERKPTASRPLGARSLITSLLLRTRPPRMRAARLVQWCGLFGVAEGTTRVALSRMVDRGELVAIDGIYELAGRAEARRAAQDWSLAPILRAWDGSWRLGIVEAGARAADERAALRDAMRHLRHAELREGVWCRPDNLPRVSAPSAWWRIADDQCVWWTATPAESVDQLADRLFAPRRWTGRAGVLKARLQNVTNALGSRGDDVIAVAFTTGAEVVAHIRADPLLPAELNPVGASEELRAAYREYEAAFADAARAWFRAR